MRARCWAWRAAWSSPRLRRAGRALSAGASGTLVASSAWCPYAFCEQGATTCAEQALPPPVGGSRNRKRPVSEGNRDYIEGIKIWGVGIKEDPIPGEKRGKGVQHLRSNTWMYDLATFIQDRYPQIEYMVRYAKTICSQPGYEAYDFRYFVNCSEGLFYRALDEGLHSKYSRDLLLMASWSLMAAAEVGIEPFYDRHYVRHSLEERRAMREEFYRQYLEPDVPFVDDKEDLEMEHVLGSFGLSSVRFDLIPAIALERLDLHNELCAVKWKKDPGAWLRDGFLISARVDSMQRHYWSVHAKDWSEDHLAHGIWNLMALYHVLVTFPENNDLINFRALREQASLADVPE